MSSGDLRITRIKASHQKEFALLGDVTRMAQEYNPKLRATAENRVAARNMTEVFSKLGAYCRANGFDPTRSFQHVANFDTEIWTLVLDMFAKHDPVTGELMDDGLLYRWNAERGCLQIDKPFFYAICDYFERQGIPVDMRGKIKLN